MRLSFREHYQGDANTCGVVVRGNELRVYGHLQRTDVMDVKAVYLRVKINVTAPPSKREVFELLPMRRRNETTWEISGVRINADESPMSVFIDDVPEAIGNRWQVLSAT